MIFDFSKLSSILSSLSSENMKEDLLKVIEKDLYDVEGRKDRNEEYLYNRVNTHKLPTQTMVRPCCSLATR